ncbi:MAG: acylphosphatase, partial [Desulfatirhabdiaceae bacterium]
MLNPDEAKLTKGIGRRTGISNPCDWKGYAMTTYARYRVRITGRVQGVSFRMETLREANRLGVTGWVKNAGDGSVEAVFEGEDGPVKAMIDWCW